MSIYGRRLIALGGSAKDPKTARVIVVEPSARDQKGSWFPNPDLINQVKTVWDKVADVISPNEFVHYDTFKEALSALIEVVEIPEAQRKLVLVVLGNCHTGDCVKCDRPEGGSGDCDALRYLLKLCQSLHVPTVWYRTRGDGDVVNRCTATHYIPNGLDPDLLAKLIRQYVTCRSSKAV